MIFSFCRLSYQDFLGLLDAKFQLVIRGINSPALGMVNNTDIQQSKVI